MLFEVALIFGKLDLKFPNSFEPFETPRGFGVFDLGSRDIFSDFRKLAHDLSFGLEIVVESEAVALKFYVVELRPLVGASAIDKLRNLSINLRPGEQLQDLCAVVLVSFQERVEASLFEHHSLTEASEVKPRDLFDYVAGGCDRLGKDLARVSVRDDVLLWL